MSTVVMDAVIGEYVKELKLPAVGREYQALARQARQDGWPYEEYLRELLDAELRSRRDRTGQRRIREARFPDVKTLDQIDWDAMDGVSRPAIASLASCEFLARAEDVIIAGPIGTGKTHLAIAIAYRAIQDGFTALFVTAAELIDHLSLASRSVKLRDSLPTYLHPHVLVVDEVGYLSYGDDAANVLFHVVNERHLRRRPIIFTTNKSPITQWGDALHDPDLAEAIVDRTLERGQLLILDGPSYRTRHLPDLALDTSQKPARIFGTDRPEFPERAAVNGTTR